LPNVNKQLAEQIQEKSKEKGLLSDPRFNKMWTEKNFERVEKEQQEHYKHLTAAKKKSIEDAFEMLPDEDEESGRTDEDMENDSYSEDSDEEKTTKSKEKKRKVDMYEIKEGYDITDAKKK